MSRRAFSFTVHPLVKGSDLNTIIYPGYYAVENPTNAPADDDYFMLVWERGMGAPNPPLVMQTLFSWTTKSISSRVFENSIWSEWVTPHSGGGYMFTTPTSLDTWVIPHNLGYYPNVTVTTVGGVEVMGGEVVHLSTNVCQISFDTAFAGSARCT